MVVSSPTCSLHTTGPWLGPSSRSLPRTTLQRVWLAKIRWYASTRPSRSTTRNSRDPASDADERLVAAGAVGAGLTAAYADSNLGLGYSTAGVGALSGVLLAIRLLFEQRSG